MAKPGDTGIIRIIYAFKYSWQGLKAAWRDEVAFRQEVLLMVVLTPASFWVGNTLVESLLLLSLVWLLAVAELLNSAVEAVVDRVGSEHHPLSGKAKDIGSAAVLVTLVLNGIVWSALIGRNLLNWW
ncbi:MAG: diacylglycerol kinase [Vibrionaceae bacterium]